eukprot:TRINITY_DN2867_c1_g5_i1.p1 TRINITY_DN2867_c1_g5~~TRINITY_DN2867_c1_g5_i1.p1  ORF type:complete len:630 (+),score=190.60 TRINITY_DN2867_c1_g5_i1:142-2031(+)
MSYELNSYGIEALVKKATDSMLLDADYTLIFEIVDLVTAHPESCIPGLVTQLKKLISPSAFQSTMSALWATSPYSGKDKKESEMEQRDVTVRALLLVEALMKNSKSGDLIITIGSKDFLNFLRKKATEKKCDIVVQQKILGMMQSWAIAFSANQIDPRQGTYHDFGSGDSRVHFVKIVRKMKEDRVNFPLPITGDSDAYSNTVEALKRWLSGSKSDREKERSSRYASPNVREHPAYPKRQIKVKKVQDDLESGRSVNDLLVDVIRANESSDLGYELATNVVGIHKRLKKAVEEGDLIRSEEGKLLEDVLVLLEDIATTLAAYDILQRGGVPPQIKKRSNREGKPSTTVTTPKVEALENRKGAPPALRNPKQNNSLGSSAPIPSGTAAKKRAVVEEDDEFAALAKERKGKESATSSPALGSNNGNGSTPDLFSLVGSPTLGAAGVSSSSPGVYSSPFMTSSSPNTNPPNFSSPLAHNNTLGNNTNTGASMPNFSSPLATGNVQNAGYAHSPLAARSSPSGNPFLDTNTTSTSANTNANTNTPFAMPPSRTMNTLPGGNNNVMNGGVSSPVMGTGASSPFFGGASSPGMSQNAQTQSPFFGLSSGTSSTPFDANLAFGASSSTSGTGSLLD